ncbi:MAG: ribonuclease [Clostridia bacterium]|nr:ribonuclease [Clostridia bacterium]
MLLSFAACTAEEVDTALEILDAVASAIPDETQAQEVPPTENTQPPSQAPPAEAPTQTPTQAPTEAPTAAPTEAPTAAPTQAPTQAPTEAPTAAPTEAPTKAEPWLPEDGQYDDKDNVALYIHLYGKLPSNYVTKKDAETLYGWQGGALDKIAPGKAIGGNYFGNNEGLLPDAKGRKWTECDIGTIGTSSRGAKRIVFSNDGLIYYTDDHYESFELLYGEE